MSQKQSPSGLPQATIPWADATTYTAPDTGAVALTRKPLQMRVAYGAIPGDSTLTLPANPHHGDEVWVKARTSGGNLNVESVTYPIDGAAAPGTDALAANDAAAYKFLKIPAGTSEWVKFAQ